MNDASPYVTCLISGSKRRNRFPDRPIGSTLKVVPRIHAEIASSWRMNAVDGHASCARQMTAVSNIRILSDSDQEVVRIPSASVAISGQGDVLFVTQCGLECETYQLALQGSITRGRMGYGAAKIKGS